MWYKAAVAPSSWQGGDPELVQGAGTDGTADVELVQGAGGSARSGEVTLPSHKLSLACQRGSVWQQGQVAAGAREVTLHQGREARLGTGR